MHLSSDESAAEIAADALEVAADITGSNREHQRSVIQVMGGKFEVILVGAPSGLIDQISDLLAALEQKWSRFLDTSEISKLNNAEGVAVAVSPETILLVEKLCQGYELTNGTFDPTTLPLTVERGFATSRQNSGNTTKLPASASWPGDVAGIAINRAQKEVTLPIGTMLDPGGLGKGLAADLAIELAKKAGAVGALVNANGDIVCFGKSTDGPHWRIGIEHPFDSDSEIEQVKIHSGAVATSSRVYQTWATESGAAHHLTDTRTGLASDSSIVSATVIAGTGARAELLTKVAFGMTIDEAIELVTKLGSAIQIIDSSLTAHSNMEWERYI